MTHTLFVICSNKYCSELISSLKSLLRDLMHSSESKKIYLNFKMLERVEIGKCNESLF